MIFPQTRPFFGGKGWRIFFFFFQTLLSLKLLLRFTNKKIRFYHISNDFCNIPGGGPKTRKLLNFGRLPTRQFSLDFKKISDLGYFYLYLQHILGALKSGKLDDPLGYGLGH